jgi:peptide deformylase
VKLKLLIHPNKALQKSCEPIGKITSKHAQLAGTMHWQLKKWNGIGLAAPQVGRLFRMFVINTINYCEENPTKATYINPEIVWSSEEQVELYEGCLSFPDQFVKIKRPEKVTVAYYDANGGVHKVTYGGITSRAIQHEYDHLNGELFLDK